MSGPNVPNTPFSWFTHALQRSPDIEPDISSTNAMALPTVGSPKKAAVPPGAPACCTREAVRPCATEAGMEAACGFGVAFATELRGACARDAAAIGPQVQVNSANPPVISLRAVNLPCTPSAATGIATISAEPAPLSDLTYGG